MEFRKDFYADVRTEKVVSTDIRFRDGVMEECKNSSVERAFLRVYDGKMWYYASTYRMDALQEELNKLYACAKGNRKIGEDPVVQRFQANKGDFRKFEKEPAVPLAQKRAFVEERLVAMQGEYVKMAVAGYDDVFKTIRFVSSKGADLIHDSFLCGACFSAVLATETDNISVPYMETKEHFADLSCPVEEIKKAVEEGEDFLLHAKPVEAGEYPVILSPQVAGGFAHESFGHKSEADFMLGDETMKQEWQLGKKVGSDILSIYDSGLVAGSGYCLFDDEGTRASKTYLIKNGILSGRLHSASTAADLQEEVTGNARAINCTFEPIVRMTTTVIEAGDLKKEELFARVKHGYFIKSFKHGSGMSTFTIAPSLAYEIVDGKIAGPVKIAVVTGNVFETLSLVDGLSDECELFPNIFGGCGKNEQSPLRVSYGGPYVSVSKMNVQ